MVDHEKPTINKKTKKPKKTSVLKNIKSKTSDIVSEEPLKSSKRKIIKTSKDAEPTSNKDDRKSENSRRVTSLKVNRKDKTTENTGTQDSNVTYIYGKRSDVKESKSGKSKKSVKSKRKSDKSSEVRDNSKPQRTVWVEEFRDGRESISHNHPFKGVKLREPGPLKRLVTRPEWEAKVGDFTRLDSLDLPITHIRYIQTGGSECRMPSECDKRVHEIQWEQMKNGSPDVRYNFLVTTNALVYEGRGWKYGPEDSQDPPGKLIDVAFVGDFTDKKVPTVMKTAAEDLIDWGVYHYKVHCCHQVVSLLSPKQDNVTDSPKNSQSQTLE